MLKINCKLSVSILSAIISLLAIINFQNKHYNNYLYSKKNIDYQTKERQLKLELSLLEQAPSFGFNNLIADWAFIKYIQYFGDTEIRKETGYSLITDYFETIVNKDSKFIRANLSLSTTNSIFAGRPEKTVALLEKSAQSLKPQMNDYPFMIFAYKAVDEILFLGDLEAAKKSYDKAAEWAEIRNDKAGNHVANLYRNTIKFLETNPDSSITQVSGWSMILERNKDPRIQKYAIQKIEELGGEVVINANGQITVKPPEKDT